MRQSITTYNLCLLGFGNVNRTLVRLLDERRKELHERHGMAWQVTGVASRRLGWIADPAGLPMSVLFAGGSPAAADSSSGADIRTWLEYAQADVLFEATSLNVYTGQPAAEHIRAALEHGAHAITANKGPVVYAYEQLSKLAQAKHRRFLFESTVMDGVPIFSLFRDSLPTVRLQGFHGVLNSTTNVILSEMERGQSFKQALAKAQELGVAETDASHDIDGWDATVKVAALVTVLMGVPLMPSQIRREGIRNLHPEELCNAYSQGKRCKLVCRARRTAHSVEASVRPELLPFSDPLAQVEGTSSIVYFETDIFPGLAITEHNPGLEATAYGMLSDFIRAVNGRT